MTKQETLQVAYIKQLLGYIDKDIMDHNSRLNSAEVNLRNLKSERKELMERLIEIEVEERKNMMAEPMPELTEAYVLEKLKRFESEE